MHAADEESKSVASDRAPRGEATADVDPYEPILGLRRVEKLDGHPVRRRDFGRLELGHGGVRGCVKEHWRVISDVNWRTHVVITWGAGKRTEWGKDHEEALSETGRDLAVVQLPNGEPFLLRQIKSNL